MAATRGAGGEGPTMRCSQAQRLLSLRRDVNLSARQVCALADHLAGCDACRRYEDSMIQVAADLAAISSVQVRGSLACNAISRWSTEANAPRRGFRPMRMIGFALAGAAALVVCGQLRRPHAPPPCACGPVVAIRPKYVAPNQPQRKVTPEAAPTLAAAPHSHRSSPVHTPPSLPGRDNPQRQTPDAPIDDMAAINADVAATFSRWNGTDVDRTQAQLDQLQQSVRGGDDFVKVPLPPIAGMG